MSGKKAVTTDERRSAQALEVYEKAVKALGKRDFEKARDHFSALLESYPDERDMIDRARSYALLCEKALERRPAFRPKTFEEQLNWGVYLHNRGEFEEAMRFLSQAAESQPKNEHAHYCFAASAARAGDTEAALKALRQAISLNVSSRTQARHDSDFDPIRDDDAFIAAVYPAE